MPNSGFAIKKYTSKGPINEMIETIPTMLPYLAVAYASEDDIIIKARNTNQPEYLSISNFLLRYFPIDFCDWLLDGSIFNVKFSND